jgi:hypothetical protein
LLQSTASLAAIAIDQEERRALTGQPHRSARNETVTRLVRAFSGSCLCVTCLIFSSSAFAADVFFNIPQTPIAIYEPVTNPSRYYADVWYENGYAYIGSDVNGGGIHVYRMNNFTNAAYLGMWPGDQREDIEVWDGYGYMGSDVSVSSGTGVDIVDFNDPGNPVHMNNFDGSDGGHEKVHTISVDYARKLMYTADNGTNVVKIVNVSNPSNPTLVSSLTVGTNSSLDSHEVYGRGNRLYVASKGASISADGWVHIFDVTNPGSPTLLKGWQAGARTHTAVASLDHNLLVVAEEGSDEGNVQIWDISNLSQGGVNTAPPLYAELNETTFCQDNNNNNSCADPGDTRIDAHSPHHPHIYGNLLFVTWYEAGLQVFNISDPSNPVWVGSFDTTLGNPDNFSGNWGVDLTAGLHRVLLSDRQNGLIVINATGVVDPGDYNQDLSVNVADYAKWQSAFGSEDANSEYEINTHLPLFGDGNYDGAVDAADYVMWRKFAGTPGGGGVSSVPEPGATILLIASIGAWIARRRARSDR